MIRSKGFTADEPPTSETPSNGEERLLLIDDAIFVSALAEAGQRNGNQLVCARCVDPTRELRAVLLLVDRTGNDDESAVGFCRGCYRDLAELMFHEAVLRASKSTD